MGIVGISSLPLIQSGDPDTRGGMIIDDYYVWISDHKQGLWRVDRCTGANDGPVSGEDSKSWDIWWYDPYGNYPEAPDAANPLAPDPTSEGYFIFEAAVNGSVYVFNTVKPTTSSDKATFITEIDTGAAIAYGIYATEATLAIPKLYVATTSGLLVYNISDPFNPTLITTLLPTLDFVSVRGIAGHGYVYANSLTDDKTYVIDITTNTVVSSISYGAITTLRRPWVYQDDAGNYFLYVVNDSGDLWIVDINNPLSPTIIASWNSPAGGIANLPGGSVYVKDDFAYVLTSKGNDQGYVYMLDVHNPTNPVLVDTLYSAAFGFNDIRIDGCEVHIAAHDGWKMYVLEGWQPDMKISNIDTSNFVGQNIFENIPVVQIKSQTVALNETAVFQIQIQNTANYADKFILTGIGSIPGWDVQYYTDSTNITAAVVAGTYITPDLAPGAYLPITLRITPITGAICSDSYEVTLKSTSEMCPEGTCSGTIDIVEADVTLGCPQLEIAKDDGKTFVTPGEATTYVIDFTNVGNATAANVIVTDILPAGVTYQSSTPVPTSIAYNTPNIGETTIIWNIGTLPAEGGIYTNTIEVMVNLDAIPGTSLENVVTANYQDINGNPFPEITASDIDTVIEIPLIKGVSDEAAMWGDTLTYSLTPNFDGDALLSNVRIIDAIPEGTTYLPGSANANGTYGPYTPLPAVPGVDLDNGLNTTMSVSTNFVNPGDPITVTLNVSSTAAVLNVSPTDLNVSGGAYTISGPVPAVANVPAGGAGVNYVWTVTPLDSAEYVFTAGAANNLETVIWPDASSASVLSSDGGPNVITWNLGSNLPPVNGVDLISGVGPGIYAFRGDDRTDFWRYDILTNSWSIQQPAPGTVKEGGALVYDGGGYLNGYIYALRGDGTNAFWRYDIDTNTWLALANTPATVKNGGAVVYLDGYVYAFRGDNTTAFWRYDPMTNTWSILANTPATVEQGGALTTDGTYIYGLRGDTSTEFWRYDPTTNTWMSLASTPLNVKWGGALTRIGNYIYATRGDDKRDFWRYDITTNTWSTMAMTPGTVKEGGALTTDGTYVYALRGDGSTGFWRYDPATNTWSVLASTPQNVKFGGALAYVEGFEPSVRITSLEATPTLVTTGDIIDVTMTLFSDVAVNNVTPSALTITSTGGATAALISGPTPISQNIAPDSFVTFTWQYLVTAGAVPGSLQFSGSATGDGPTIFPTGTSNSVLVSPILTYQVTINANADSPIVNTALFLEDNYFISGVESNQVVTIIGGSIGDYIWYDADGDGVQDLTETGISSVTVILTPPAGVDLGNGPGVPITTVTDVNGYYLFDSLPAGIYTVTVDTTTLPLGMVETYDPDGIFDNSTTVNLAAGEQYTLADFGYDDSGVIGDTVFADANGNGVQDPGELGIPNITVKLWQDTNNNGIIDEGDILIDETVTDALGNYTFTGLPAEAYIVAVDETDPDMPAGYEATTLNPLPVILGTGEIYNDADFGFTDLGSISGVIWYDEDNDCLQDIDEVVFAGIQVVLTGPTGTFYTTTDANGAYSFTNLPSGNYTVTVNTSTLPLGYVESCDPDPILDNSTSVTLNVGENYIADFGYIGAGGIGDRVWLDTNGNGLQDPGEVGIAGVTVWLYDDINGNGLIDSGEPLLATTITDVNGNYSFNDLPPGDYVVMVDQSALPNYTATTLNPLPVTLMAGQINNNIDFGFGPYAQIGDFVWEDINGNGIQDPGEPGIAGVTVTLTPPAGVDLGNGPGVPINTVTDAFGYYLFDSLPPGQYTVTVTTPGGFVPTTTTSYVETLLAGEYSLTNDFGFIGNGSIGDIVWLDTNGNGIQDPGEVGIGGVRVYLYEDANNNGFFDDGEPLVDFTITAPDGSYLFDNLAPGQYLVHIDSTDYPAGTGPTTPTLFVVPLGENEDYLLADFGFGPFSSIGDTVFFDANYNGIRDTGSTDEYGIPGVTINLYQTDQFCNPISGIIATAVTDAYGNYFFEGLLPGNYLVDLDETTIPAGLTVTTPSGASYCLTLDPFEYYSQADFGVNGTSSIGDLVWNDINGNGIQDPGEPGVPGATVELWLDINGDGILNTGIGGDLLVTSTVTDANGNYIFDNLNIGTYFVRIIIPDGYAATTPIVLTENIAIDGTIITNADFGIAQIFVNIGDFVWLDLNANGLQDPGEPGLPNVTVRLFAADCTTLIATTVTDLAGNYIFLGIPPGSYCVQVDSSTLPAGMNLLPTLANVGTDDTIDSDSIGGAPVPVTVTTGFDDTIDFGYYQVRTDIAVTKVHDYDPVYPSNTVTYSIVVTNNGPNIATNVVLVDTLPAGVTFVSATPGYMGPNPLIWNVGNLNVGESRVYNITVTVNPGATGVILNTATVSSNEFDPLPGNNFAQDIIVLANIFIQILKYVSVDNGITWQDANTSPGPYLPPGVTPLFRFVITNVSNVTLTDLLVTDSVHGGIGSLPTLLPGQSFEWIVAGP